MCQFFTWNIFFKKQKKRAPIYKEDFVFLTMKIEYFILIHEPMDELYTRKYMTSHELPSHTKAILLYNADLWFNTGVSMRTYVCACMLVCAFVLLCMNVSVFVHLYVSLFSCECVCMLEPLPNFLSTDSLIIPLYKSPSIKLFLNIYSRTLDNFLHKKKNCNRLKIIIKNKTPNKQTKIYPSNRDIPALPQIHVLYRQG